MMYEPETLFVSLFNTKCLFGPPDGEVLWIHAFLYASDQFFSRSIFFFKIYHFLRNLETEKKWQADFSEKFLFALNRKKVPKMSFHKVLSLLFSGKNLKWKPSQVCFSVPTPYICENSCSKVLGQNIFIKLDCRILWSSISLKVMYQFLRFFIWRYPRLSGGTFG